MSTYNKDLIINTKLWILKSEFLTCFAHSLMKWKKL